jgi:hypothetical protein
MDDDCDSPTSGISAKEAALFVLVMGACLASIDFLPRGETFSIYQWPVLKTRVA